MARDTVYDSIFEDRRKRNRRKYSLTSTYSEKRGGGERRSRNGLFSTTDKAWWLKVNYLDRGIAASEKIAHKHKTGS